jgi:hypothetical protein
MITPENHNEENLHQQHHSEENHIENIHNQEGHNPENDSEEDEENRKTIYKETPTDREGKDPGDSSSVADIGRTDFARRAERKHNPLGSGHEPGTL